MSGNRKKCHIGDLSILAAGKVLDSKGDSVATCLKYYSIDDAENALKLTAKIPDSKTKYSFEAYENKMRRGIFTRIKPILQPPVKTRFQTLINELKETTYDSHWNQVVGRPRDPTAAFPKGFKPLEFTFGIQSNKDESVKELVNPSKGVYQVLTESQVGHELYRKSHNDYNPGEQVCRNYLAPSFNPSNRFGYRSKYDPRGIWVKCACTWHKNEPVVFTNEIQANFIKKRRDKLGERLKKNELPDHVPKDFVFGISTKGGKDDVEDLLKDPDCPQCPFKRDMKTWLSALNKCFLLLQKKRQPDWNLDDLRKRFLYYDCDKSDMLPLCTFYQVCHCHDFIFDRANIEPLLRLLSIIVDDRINYVEFLNLVNTAGKSIRLFKVCEVPENHLYYVSTYQAAVCDHLFIDNSCDLPAGIPSIRSDLARPVVPHGSCRADLENIGDETSAGMLLNPTVFLNYGISFKDFFIPRERSVIRRLFENAGYTMDDVFFEKLWEEGLKLDETGFVCVNTFNELLQKYNQIQKTIIADEATC